MNVNGTLFVCIVLVTGIVLSAGCLTTKPPDNKSIITNPSSPTMTPASVVPSITVPEVPVPITTGTAIVTPTVPETIPVTVTTSWIQKSSEANSIDNPKIVILSFDRDYFRIPVPDCGMKVVLPQVANDTEYGIKQQVPKLIALSEDQFNGFLNTFEGNYTGEVSSSSFFDPALLGGSRCAGIPANPTWNFIRINATLIPRNGNPADYDMGINVRSHGRVIEQFRINMTLIIDQPVIFTRYIPLRSDEMDLFDSIEMVFSKRS